MEELYSKLESLLEMLQDVENSRLKEANWLSSLADMITEVQEKLLLVQKVIEYDQECSRDYIQSINEAWDSRND